MEIFVLVVVLQFLMVELKCVLMKDGALSAVITGIIMMPVLCVVSWDTLLMVCCLSLIHLSTVLPCLSSNE